MRAASALCLLLFSGCAAATRQTEEPVPHSEPEIRREDGVLKPVALTTGGPVVVTTTDREPCQTNDPMPTGSFDVPPAQMLNVRPLHVAPMPNYCPVTAPTRTKSVTTSVPRSPKSVPAPVPAEPAP